MSLPTFEFLYTYQKQEFPEDGILLSLDPGQTTGFTVISIQNSLPVLGEYGQLDTSTPVQAAKEIHRLFDEVGPTHVVLEEYRVYGHKAKEHTGNELMTSRVIGMIEHTCVIKGIKQPHKQMASIAKQFCTDEKLKAWGYWYKGLRHARDSARHALYYLLFAHRKHLEAKE